MYIGEKNVRGGGRTSGRRGEQTSREGQFLLCGGLIHPGKKSRVKRGKRKKGYRAAREKPRRAKRVGNF